MKNIKTVSLLVTLIAFGAQIVSAQAYYPSSTLVSTGSPQAGSCVNISRDLSIGMRNADISQVQRFLVTQNYPGGGSWMVTGYFGAATMQAVRDFQQVQGLQMTGVVDSATRAALSRMTCNGYVAPTPSYTNPWNSNTNYNNNYNSYPNTNYTNNYPYTNYSYGTTYPYNNLTSLNLTSLSQNTGFSGQQITVYGTGFDAQNNTVYFGSVVLSNIPSNGTSLNFTIPSYGAVGSNINIYITNSRGTSNSLSFTLYGGSYGCQGNNYGSLYNSYNQCNCSGSYYGSGNAYNSGNNCGTYGNPGNVNQPTITFLNPLSGGVGTNVTVIGSGFTSSNNTVHFGNGIIANLASNDGQSVSFTIPSQLTGYGSQLVGLGAYNVSVTNGAGNSTNVLQFTVTSLGSGTGSNTNLTPTVSYISPNNAQVGQSVTIYGSGFTGANTILFGNGALQNVYTTSGTSLTFTIPSQVGPYCAAGNYCAQYLVSITPGTYNLSVMNTNGTSNTVPFSVQ